MAFTGGEQHGTDAQAARLPTIAAAIQRPTLQRPPDMTLLLLEALGALLLLVFIVWWTMFSGRKKGELPDEVQREKEHKGDGRPPAA